MIPAGGIGAVQLVEAQEPSRTWFIDMKSNRLKGMTDGLEAMKQAVFLILNTERFHFLIFSDNYGSELQGLLGKSGRFVRAEIERRIREALLQDSRISNVTFDAIEESDEGLTVNFTVTSTEGSFQYTQEVRL